MLGENLWVKGDLIKKYETKTYCIKPNKEVAAHYPVDKETIGQFTGLKDKNGTKIFEGDVVSCKTSAYFFEKCKVVYESCYARYCAIDRHGYKYPMDETFEYEVLGNLYDHPELLEGGAADDT